MFQKAREFKEGDLVVNTCMLGSARELGRIDIHYHGSTEEMIDWLSSDTVLEVTDVYKNRISCMEEESGMEFTYHPLELRYAD